MVVQELITCSLIDKFVHFVMVPFVRAKVDLQGYRLSHSLSTVLLSSVKLSNISKTTPITKASRQNTSVSNHDLFAFSIMKMRFINVK